MAVVIERTTGTGLTFPNGDGWDVRDGMVNVFRPLTPAELAEDGRGFQKRTQVASVNVADVSAVYLADEKKKPD